MPEHNVCFHCEIVIDPRFDEPHQVVIEGDTETICDSCMNCYLSFGETFGDRFYHEHGWGECAHKQWAEEEMAVRAVIA